jgi:hypothetical protein
MRDSEAKMLHTSEIFRGVSQFREFTCKRWAGGTNDVGGCMAIDSRVKNQYALIAKSQILAVSELEQTVYELGLKDPDFSTEEEQYNRILRINPGKLLPKGFMKYFPIYLDKVSVILLIWACPPQQHAHAHMYTLVTHARTSCFNMLSCFLKRCSHFKFLHMVLPTAFQDIKFMVDTGVDKTTMTQVSVILLLCVCPPQQHAYAHAHMYTLVTHARTSCFNICPVFSNVAHTHTHTLQVLTHGSSD